MPSESANNSPAVGTQLRGSSVGRARDDEHRERREDEMDILHILKY